MSFIEYSEIKELDQEKAGMFFNRLDKWKEENRHKNTEQYLKDKDKYINKLYKELKIGWE